MMRAIVTGATGFLGTLVARALAGRGVEVVGLCRRGLPSVEGVRFLSTDLLDCSSDALFSELKADLLIHTAWETTHGTFWHAPENSLWEQRSVAMTRSFLDAGGRHVVGLGTCVEYDLTGLERLDEYRSDIKPVHPYGLAKHRTHLAMHDLCENAQAVLTWARIFHLFGRNENPARLVPSVIRALLRAEEARVTIGTQCRDFLHAADVAGAIVHLALGQHAGCFNIGSGQSDTIASLVKQVGDMLGASHLVRLGAFPLKPDDPMSILPRIDRLAATGFRPSLTLNQGLEDVIAFWKASA